jgi:hypothetical protein
VRLALLFVVVRKRALDVYDTLIPPSSRVTVPAEVLSAVMRL